MYLKTSVREALFKIDQLIKQGVEMMNGIRGDYWDDYKNPIITDPKEYRELEDQKIEDIDFEEFEALEGKTRKWLDLCKATLKEIFIDSAHFYRFVSASKEVVIQRRYNSKFIQIELLLEAKLDVLSDYFFELYPLASAPLSYNPESARIHYYDFVQQLVPDTHEASLCSLLFQKGIGETVDFTDAYAFMTGESLEEIHKWKNGWKNTITGAYDGINRKTNKSFGFNLLSKSKNQICLNFPGRPMR